MSLSATIEEHLSHLDQLRRDLVLLERQRADVELHWHTMVAEQARVQRPSSSEFAWRRALIRLSVTAERAGIALPSAGKTSPAAVDSGYDNTWQEVVKGSAEAAHARMAMQVAQLEREILLHGLLHGV